MRDSQGNSRSYFHPRYMLKDFFDTFKPYKGWFYVKRDFLQPVDGILLIGSGFKSCAIGLVHRNIRTFGLGIVGIIRGFTQLLATPLTWIIRMPLRTALTVFTGFQSFEASERIQNEVMQGIKMLSILYDFNNMVDHKQLLTQAVNQYCVLENSTLDEKLVHKIQMLNKITQLQNPLNAQIHTITLQANVIGSTLMRKFKKARDRNQPTSIDMAQLKGLEIRKNKNTDKLQLEPFKTGLKLFARDQSHLFARPKNNKANLFALEINQALIETKVLARQLKRQ